MNAPKTQIHPSALAEILRAMEKDLKQKKSPQSGQITKGVIDDEKAKPYASPKTL